MRQTRWMLLTTTMVVAIAWAVAARVQPEASND
jgi:hypothetical protein